MFKCKILIAPGMTSLPTEPGPGFDSTSPDSNSIIINNLKKWTLTELHREIKEPHISLSLESKYKSNSIEYIVDEVSQWRAQRFHVVLDLQ